MPVFTHAPHARRAPECAIREDVRRGDRNDVGRDPQVEAEWFTIAAQVGCDLHGDRREQQDPSASRLHRPTTALSIMVMLWLARAKRETGEALGSRALIADAQQTYACW